MVVGLLGILKAGGAYVPLDPEYPPERLGYMLEDARVPVLLTQERIRERLPESDARIVELDKEWEQIARESSEDLPSVTEGENAAYVMYTSGSTGRPKGVVVTHGGLTNYLLWGAGNYAMEGRAGAPIHSSISFDLTITSLYVPLIRGDHIILFGNKKNIEEVTDTLAASRDLGLLKVTPSHLEALTLHGAGAFRGVVQVLIIGGEALSQQQLMKWREECPETRLINEYGPTETVVGCCSYEVAERDALSGSVPIGRPIANTQMYVLDLDLHPVPVGVAGELYIGGAGLGRGYLNQPGMTAEKFVANPYSKESGARMYRTGDLGRWRTDGELEFLGRIDEQVKIRGYRIEPGEIEAVLREQGGVREAAVVAREEEGQKRLVAYVVWEEGDGKPSVGELRKVLQGRLPEYMVPSAFVFLERLPLTANGKLDRRALPKPGERPEQGREYVGPRTAVEEILCGIWAKVLGLERVGVEDNFFELGGHSLLATQAVSQVRKAFSVELELRRLFESPTVMELAKAIERARTHGPKEEMPPLEQVSRAGELALSYAQERLWIIDQLEPGSAAYNIPIAIRIRGRLDVDSLEKTLQELVRRHEVLRTRIEMRGGRCVQVIEPAKRELLEREVLGGLSSEKREEEVSRKVLEETGRTFDLEHGPLLRVRVLKLGEEEHVLLVTMHHIVSDGWSMGVLVREVARLYEAFVKGEESPLPELGIQYADYAVWQREWLQGEILEGQLKYWREQLKDVPVLEMPTDHPRPAVASHRGAGVPVQISREVLKGLKELSGQEGMTLFMVLLAGFQVMLSRYSGQEDVVVGAPISNRTHVELEELIGFFVNQLVLRVDLSGDPSVREMLRRVREVCLGAYAHQDLPFERLVEDLNPKRDLSREPLFQVMLVLQNAPIGELRMGGLELTGVPQGNGMAKFDLLLNLQEANETVVGDCAYATDLYERATIERMLGHWERVLEEMVAKPEGRISEIKMMREEERRQVMEEGNRRSMSSEGVIGFRASPWQRQLWRESGTGFVQGITFLIRGRLDVQLFTGAIREVAGQKEICRTRLLLPDGMSDPLQSISERAEV